MPLRPFPHNRIAIIGTSGCGKSTLARELARLLDAEYIELDRLYHGPNWTPRPDEIFIPSVRTRLAAKRWVIDGNYGNRAGQFEASDLIIWLDYPFPIVLWRVVLRTIRRLLRNEELWNGNRESLKMAFSRESIILWVFQTYWKRKRETPLILKSPAFEGVEKLRFRHPREVRAWLRDVEKSIRIN